MASRNLPPLYSIGRSRRVDQDEPPTVLPHFQSHHSVEINEFEESEAAPLEQALATLFTILPSGDVIYKRNSDQSCLFSHCQPSISFGRRFSELHNLLTSRAQMQLLRDCACRLQSVCYFIKDIEFKMKCEFQTWNDINHNRLQCPPETKLEDLNSVCEELRKHTSHWQTIGRLMQSEKYLNSMRSRLTLELELMRRRMFEARDRAIFWVEWLIRLGLQVLPHCDSERLTHDSLWNITRGIEDFNSVVIGVRCENVLHSEQPLWHPHCVNFNVRDLLQSSNRLGNLADSARPIPLLRILNILANERAKYAAIMMHHYLTASSDLLSAVSSLNFKKCTWFEWRKCYQSSSNKLWGLDSPDLSWCDCPLMSFVQREEQFALRFLQSVCESTSLLKLNQTGSRKVGKKSMVRLELQHGDEQSGSSRKSVSWGDTADVSVKQQLKDKYFELLWGLFGVQLFGFMQDLVWGVDMADSLMGSLTICQSKAVLMLMHTTNIVILKDIFHECAINPLHAVLRKLLIGQCWKDWDCAFRAAIVSLARKCQIVVSAEGASCTDVCSNLCKSFEPLQVALHVFGGIKNQSDSDRGQSFRTASTLSMMVATVQRAVATCEKAVHWCDSRGTSYLASWDLQAFLLVTQGDIKLLSDAGFRCIMSAQSIILTAANALTSLALSEQRLESLLAKLWKLLNDHTATLQGLSGLMLKKYVEKYSENCQIFFEEFMPGGKIWKRKANSQELPSSVSPYAEKAMTMLIEPLFGASQNLSSSSQIAVISMSVDGLCKAWLSVIQVRKIKFSVFGAQQLQLDFSHVRVFVEQNVINADVSQSVLALDVFKQMDTIVGLLQNQPSSRSSRPSSDKVGQCPQDGGDIRLKRPVSETLSLEASQAKVSNPEIWLALRQHGGNRTWPRLPSCLNSH